MTKIEIPNGWRVVQPQPEKYERGMCFFDGGRVVEVAGSAGMSVSRGVPVVEPTRLDTRPRYMIFPVNERVPADIDWSKPRAWLVTDVLGDDVPEQPGLWTVWKQRIAGDGWYRLTVPHGFREALCFVVGTDRANGVIVPDGQHPRDTYGDRTLAQIRGEVEPANALSLLDDAQAVEQPREHICTEGRPGSHECEACGERDCLQGEPLHYHRDGCPACSTSEPKLDEALAVLDVVTCRYTGRRYRVVKPQPLAYHPKALVYDARKQIVHQARQFGVSIAGRSAPRSALSGHIPDARAYPAGASSYRLGDRFLVVELIEVEDESLPVPVRYDGTCRCGAAVAPGCDGVEVCTKSPDHCTLCGVHTCQHRRRVEATARSLADRSDLPDGPTRRGDRYNRRPNALPGGDNAELLDMPDADRPRWRW